MTYLAVEQAQCSAAVLLVLVRRAQLPGRSREVRHIATAGERGNELFVIIAGEAVVRTARGRTVRLGPGKFFGEMSLIDGRPRSADVDAGTDMRLLVVGRREFWALLGAAPPLVHTIMQTLSTRVREAEASVSA